LVSWGNGNYNRESAQILEPARLYKLLQQKAIEHLSIQFSHHPRGKAYYQRCPPQLQRIGFDNEFFTRGHRISGFKNLTSLELYSLSYEWYETDDLIADFAELLLGSPHLKKLGISLATRWDPNTSLMIDSPYFPISFYPTLSNDYARMEGSRPLAIETLRLGDGIEIAEDVAGQSHQSKCIY